MRINPLFLFPLVWLSLIILSSIVTSTGLLDFDYFSLKFYFFLLLFVFSWLLGGGLAVFIFTKNILQRIFPKTLGLSFNQSIRLVCFIFIFSAVFKFLEIQAVTGNFSIGVSNIELYRLLVTEEGVPLSYNFVNIFNVILFCSPVISYICWKKGDKKKAVLFFLAFLFFSYLSSARSFVFLSILVLIFYLNINGKGIKNAFLLFGLIFISFGVIGEIVGKPGFSPFFIYLIAPAHAFDIILNNEVLNYELLSFRPIHGLLFDIGLISSKFHLLDYLETPYPVNVYTVFGVYYNDFGIFGTCVAVFFFSFVSSFFYKLALYVNEVRYQLIASFYMSYIILGVFYDYYTSSFFALAAPFILLFLMPKETINIVRE